MAERRRDAHPGYRTGSEGLPVEEAMDEPVKTRSYGRLMSRSVPPPDQPGFLGFGMLPLSALGFALFYLLAHPDLKSPNARGGCV